MTKTFKFSNFSIGIIYTILSMPFFKFSENLILKNYIRKFLIFDIV